MRQKGMFFLLIVMLPLLTSCWGRTEVIDIALVTAIAIDKGENEDILLSLQIAVPKSLGAQDGQGSGKSESTIVVSEEGESIMQVYRKIQMKLSREIFFAHNSVIIIGEELATEGVSSVLDFFSRYRQPQLASTILFTKEKASEVLSLNPHIEAMTSEEITEQEKRGAGLEVKVRDFVTRMLADGDEPFASQISSKTLQKEDDSSELVPSLDGAAIFKGDKLKGWMNGIESRGVLWIRDEYMSGVITVKVIDDRGGGNIGAEIRQVSSKIKAEVSKEKVKIIVKTYGDVEIFENSSQLDLNDPEKLQTVKKMFEEDVKDRLELTLDKAQKELGSDIFGFGHAVYRSNPKLWNDVYKNKWEEVFPEIEIEIATEIKLKGTGFSSQSMTLSN
ncbi:Ger(x)C family spore germination protein [Oceanobacillus polygoni]|uniref:Spore germination protein KC n=1 Tax=Oceanobacillus polygoni TaxID=1235259 RepID=A0A9X1CEU5_9BACI|nr:Ger(x)C family spore germination protein [Oceanobacillus polygoni]MBP2076453.1 spore germination protein KC [Oceanobacillus polygoni]